MGSRNCNSQQRPDWGVAAGRADLEETVGLILVQPPRLGSNVSLSHWASAEEWENQSPRCEVSGLGPGNRPKCEMQVGKVCAMHPGRGALLKR